MAARASLTPLLMPLLKVRPTAASCTWPLRDNSPFGGRILSLRSTTSCGRLFANSAAVQVKKFTEEHEWIELDSDGTTGTIGISQYAAKALGDVVYVELPQVDVEFRAGDTIGAVESVKSASDILAPVAGTIIEANSMLEEKPGSINKSPEGEAWIAKVKVKNTAELDDLMDADAYGKFTAEE